MGAFSASLALCAGNSPVTGEFPSQRPVTRSIDVFFHLCLNKRLSKQSWGWWFETPSCSLWRHCNAMMLNQGSFLYMHSANERRRYIVTSSLIGWAHTQNDPCSMWEISSSLNYIISIKFAPLYGTEISLGTTSSQHVSTCCWWQGTKIDWHVSTGLW